MTPRQPNTWDRRRVSCLMCGLASRSVAPVRHEANDPLLPLVETRRPRLVTWTANGTIVSIRVVDGGTIIVEGPSGHEIARNLPRAIARVGAALHQILAGSTGLSGWSLTLEFPGIRAPYGDAPPNPGSGSGRPTDVGACANAIYDRRLQPHPAIANSIDIVRSCWSPAEAVA